VDSLVNSRRKDGTLAQEKHQVDPFRVLVGYQSGTIMLESQFSRRIYKVEDAYLSIMDDIIKGILGIT
jgi:hypothetical protein